MNNKEFIKKKKELMKPGWTEDLHHELEALNQEDAKKIVESMTDKEIYIKVNNRQFQEDYIADYIEYLWEISEEAYWKHIIITLDVDIGILWSDNMSHFEKMCNTRIPDDILKAILNLVIKYNEKEENDLDAVGCVIKAQIKDFNRLDEINVYTASLGNNQQKIIDERIKKMVSSKSKYMFYED